MSGERVQDYVFRARFENEQFDRNIQTSIGVLGKLKEALNFKGHEAAFDNVAKSAERMNLDKIAQDVDRLAARFSTLGIVGMTTIQNVTNAIEGGLAKTIDNIFNKIKSGGIRRAMNVENARFMMEGLFPKDLDRVKAMLDDAMNSVTDTAYGYDQAAKAAASFAASGLKAGEQLQHALGGITGVAAITNSEYQSISEIFTTVASQGRVMGYQLQQLAFRGLNASATLKDYFNGVQKGSIDASAAMKKSIAEVTKGKEITEGDIRDLVSKSAITFDMFSEAMYTKFAEHAKDANKTVTGVLSNINARFSQIGEKFVSPLIMKEGPVNQFLNTILNKLTEIRNNIQPLADLFTGGVIKGLSVVQDYIKGIDVVGFFGKFNQGVKTVAAGLNPYSAIFDTTLKNLKLSKVELSALEKILKGVAKSHGIEIDSMIKSEGSFLNTLKSGWLSFDMFKEGFDKIFGKSESDKAVKNIEAIREAAIKTIRGDYGNGIPGARQDALTAAGYDYQVVQDYVNKVHELTGGTWKLNDAILAAADAEIGGANALSKMSDEQLKKLGYTKEEIKALKELAKIAKDTGTPLYELLNGIHDPFYGVKLIIDSVKNAIDGVIKIVGTAKKAFTDVFPPIASTQIIGFLANVNKLSKSLIVSDEVANRFYRTFKGVFSLIKMVGKGVLEVANFVLPVFAGVLGFVGDLILKVTATIGDWITEFAEAAEKTQIFTKLLTPVKFVINVIIGLITSVVSGIAQFLGAISNLITEHHIITSVLTKISDVIDIVGKAINKVVGFISSSDGAMSLLTANVGKAGHAFNDLVKKNELASKVFKLITNAFSAARTKLSELVKGIKNAGSIVNFLKNKFEDAKQAVVDWVVKHDRILFFINTLKDAISKVSDKISDFIEKFKSLPIAERLKTLKGSLDGFGSKFKSNVIIPAFNKLSEYAGKLRDALPIIQQYLQPIYDKIKSIGDIISSKFQNFSLQKLIGNFKLPSFDGLIETLAKLVGFVGIKFVIPGINAVLGVIEKLSAHLPTLEQVIAFITDLAKKLNTNVIAPALKAIGKAFEYISERKPSLEEIIKIITDFIDKLKSINIPGLDKITGFFDKLFGTSNVSGANTMVASVAKITSADFKTQGLKTFTELIEELRQKMIDPWVEKFKAFYDMLNRDWGFPSLEEIRSAVKYIMEALKGADEQKLSKLYRWVTRIQGLLMARAFRKALVSASKAFKEMSTAWTGFGESFKGIGDSVKGVFDTLTESIKGAGKFLSGEISGFFKAWKKSFKYNAILKIAIAIGIVALAFYKLSQLDEHELAHAAQGMLVVAGALVGLYAAIVIVNKLGKVRTYSMKAIGEMMLGFAVAAYIVAIATKKLAALKPEEIAIAGAIMTVLMVVLGACSKGFDKLEVHPKSLAAPFAFVVALGLLALEMCAVSLLPLSLAERGLAYMFVLAVILGLAMQAFRGLETNIPSLFAPLLFTTGLLKLALALIVIGLIPLDLFDAGSLRLFAMGSLLMVALWLLSLMPLTPPSVAAPIALVFSLLVLAGDIVLLGLIPIYLLVKGGLAAWALLTMLSRVAAGMAKASADCAMALPTVLAPLTLAASILLVAFAVIAIGQFAKEEMLWQSLSVVGIIMAALTFCIWALSTIQNEVSFKGIAGVISFAIGVGLLALELVLIGNMAKEGAILKGQGAIIIAAVALMVVAEVFNNIKINPAMVIMPLEFVIVFAVLMAEIVLFGKIPVDQIGRGGLVMLLAVLGLVTVGILLHNLDLKPESLIMPILFIAMVFTLLEAMREIGTMDDGEWFKAVVGVCAVLLSMAIAFATLSKFTQQIDQLAGSFIKFAAGAVILAGAFFIVSAGMVVFAYAMTMMADVPWQIVAGGVAAIFLGLIALGVATKLVKGSALEMIALAASFVLVAGGMILFASAMTIMANVPWQIVAGGIVGMAVGLLLLTVAAGAGAGPILAAGAAFLMLSVGAIALGVAFLLVSAGVGVMASAFTLLTNIPFEKLLVSIIGIAAAIFLIGVAAGAGALPLLAVGAAFLMVGVGVAIALTALSAFAGVMPQFSENIGAAFQALGYNVTTGLANGIKAGISFVGEAITNVAGGIVGTFAKLLGIESPSVVMAALSYFIPVGAKVGIEAGTGEAEGASSALGSGILNSFGTGLLGQGGEGQGVESMINQFLGQVETGLADPAGNVEAGASELSSKAEEQMKSMFSQTTAGEEVPGTVGNNITENADAVTPGVDSMTSKIEEMMQQYTGSDILKNYGMEIPTTVGDGVDTGSVDFTKALTDMGMGGNEELLSYFNGGDVTATGEEFDSILSGGISNNAGEVNEAGESVAREGVFGANSTRPKWEGVGENLSGGLARGIRNGESGVISAAVDVAINAYNAAKSALDINSPSKLFAKLGEGIDEGYVKGMRDKEGEVTSKSEELVTQMFKTSSDAIDNFVDLLNSDIIDNPVITPVMDLSKIQNGADRLYSMIADADRLNFRGNIDLADSTNRSVNAASRRKQDSDNQMMTSLIDAINGLSALIGNTGNVYNVNGVTYDDGSNVSTAVRSLLRAAKIEGRA